MIRAAPRGHRRVLAGKSTDVLQQCEEHEAHAGNNHYPFLWRFYASHRPTLFRIWREVRLRSTCHDTSIEKALQLFLITNIIGPNG